ncbi:MAG: YihY/virulence factor BrkB family protein [Pseudomonadota bacterium]|nr:YihY/virulence factor BrkB family protein [Pseudomonadota bacterium]
MPETDAQRVDRLRRAAQELEVGRPRGREVAEPKDRPAKQAEASSGADAARGREAEHPQQIPLAGWKDVIVRAWRDTGEKQLSLIAGGVTYYVLLALFPGLAALVSIYGLVADPKEVERQINSMSGLLPGDAKNLIGAELHQLVSASSGALSFGVALGIVLALWSASRGMSGMITALDIAYGQQEKRGFFKFNLIAILLTVGLLVVGIIALALVAVLPALVAGSNTGSVGKWVVLIVEWPILIAVVMSVLAVLYRYAPDRDQPRWLWSSPGAIVATLLWIIGSVAFTVYVANFNSYNKTYGSLGALVILLTWLWLSSFVVLFGAEINAESERQTRRDTTTGPPQEMGRRGATAADTVG